MSTQKGVLGYWDFRGLGQPIRCLCHYLGVDYEEKTYTKGADLKGDSWFSVKYSQNLEFPNIPYWKDDNIKLTETKAILKYLARRHDPSLVPTELNSQATAEMVEGFIQDLQAYLVRLLFYSQSAPPSQEEVTKFETSIQQPLQRLEDFLSKRQWVVGDNLSYVDFYTYEILYQLNKYKVDFLKNFPSLQSYIKRFEEIPKNVEHVKKSVGMTCFGANAAIYY